MSGDVGRKNRSRKTGTPRTDGMRWLRLVVLTALASLLASPRIARANGRFPTANQLVVQPSNASRIVLRTTFGLLVSNDSGQNWDWICEDGFGIVGTYDPPIGVFQNGRTIVGDYDGLRVSSTDQCNFDRAPGPVGTRVVADVVVRPDQPNVGIVVTSTPEVDDASLTATYENLVFVTTDGAGTFSQLGNPLDSDIFVETIEVAASDPNRLYVSGTRAGASSPEGVFLSSQDLGLSWTRVVIPLTGTEQAPYIATVAADNADLVYIRTNDPTNGLSRLIITDDGGQTFRAVFDGGTISGFALSADGGIFMGGPDLGLLVGDNQSFIFVPRADADVESLTLWDGGLFACATEVSGYLVRLSNDQGITFKQLLDLGSIRGPLACAPDAGVAICAGEWSAFENMYGDPAVPLTPDAAVDASLAQGPIDGGSEEAADATTAGPPTSPRRGSGCSTTSGAGSGATFASLALSVLALVTLNRSRRRASRA